MSKAKQIVKPVELLIEAKLAELSIHAHLPYMQANKARNACYSSTSAFQYKSKMHADQVATVDILSEQASKGVAVLQHEKALSLLDSITEELYEYRNDMEANYHVYKLITGKEYAHPAKK